MDKYLEAGKIVSTHALKGEVRVEVWCNSVEEFCTLRTLYFNNGTQKIKVKSRPNKNVAIMKIDGIDNINDADLLRGKVVYVDRDDIELDDEEFFIQDIIGLTVKDIDTCIEYGTITDVFNTGANDIYQMRDKNGRDVYIPVIDDIVKSVDLDNNVVFIKVMKGLFDDED